MMLSIKCITGLFFVSVSMSAFSEPVDLYCDAKSNSLILGSITSDNTEAFTLKKVEWEDLLIMSKKKSVGGQDLKGGSKRREVRCGDLKITFKYGYLNPDFQGQSGADDFPIVNIKKSKETIIPDTALEVCSQTEPRLGLFYKGKCPNGWATFIHVKNGKLIEVVSNYYDENNDEKVFRRTEARQK